MEMTSSSTAEMPKNDDVQAVWHTGMEANGGTKEGGGCENKQGSCKRQRVILVGWDRGRGLIFAGFSVAFVIWAAVFFPLILN